jgi:Ca2+-binding RTX toxin-like protein
VPIGGAGSDLLTGGQGDDRFVFVAGQGVVGDVDTVTDFSKGDRIVLQGGLTVTLTTEVDVTNDGCVDTVLQLSDQTTVVLAGFTGWKADLLI